jgi:hypothetical protein
MAPVSKAALLLVLAWRAGALAAGFQGTNVAPLRGRFLHLTDIHPDPYYVTNASVSAACHWMAPHDDPHRAGYWGTPVRFACSLSGVSSSHSSS